MIRRFLHDSFEVTVPCACCSGEVEFRVEGHYDDHENFRVESVTNLHTKKEVIPSEAQAAKIDIRAAERFAETLQQEREHQHAITHDYADRV